MRTILRIKLAGVTCFLAAAACGGAVSGERGEDGGRAGTVDESVPPGDEAMEAPATSEEMTTEPTTDSKANDMASEPGSEPTGGNDTTSGDAQTCAPAPARTPIVQPECPYVTPSLCDACLADRCASDLRNCAAAGDPGCECGCETGEEPQCYFMDCRNWLCSEFCGEAANDGYQCTADCQQACSSLEACTPDGFDAMECLEKCAMSEWLDEKRCFAATIVSVAEEGCDVMLDAYARYPESAVNPACGP